MIYTAHNSFDEIEGKHILDIGCGTGMLAIASMLLGARAITAVDVDISALKVARKNIDIVLGGLRLFVLLYFYAICLNFKTDSIPILYRTIFK